MEEQKTLKDIERENKIRRENLNLETFIIFPPKIKKESEGVRSSDLEFKENVKGGLK